MTKKFTIKPKPIKPELEKFVIYDYHYVADGDTVAGLPADGVFEIEHRDGYYGDSCSYSLQIKTANKEESEKAYMTEVSNYEKKLEKYNRWCKENKDKIEAELKRQILEREEESERSQEREKIRLEKELIKIEKELARMKTKSWLK
jgi:hypothetical protein